MLRYKVGVCECGYEGPLIAGKCNFCYWRGRRKVSEKKKAQGNAPRLPLLTPKLNQWFEFVATSIRADPYCWECRTYIPESFYRHASAHIIPKSIFPSVAIHPLNFIILGASCGCHSKYDSSIENACKMRIWKIATGRFLLFENKIIETHKYLDLFKSKI